MPGMPPFGAWGAPPPGWGAPPMQGGYSQPPSQPNGAYGQVPPGFPPGYGQVGPGGFPPPPVAAPWAAYGQPAPAPPAPSAPTSTETYPGMCRPLGRDCCRMYVIVNRAMSTRRVHGPRSRSRPTRTFCFGTTSRFCSAGATRFGAGAGGYRRCGDGIYVNCWPT